jgi:hypothetical protein
MKLTFCTYDGSDVHCNRNRKPLWFLLFYLLGYVKLDSPKLHCYIKVSVISECSLVMQVQEGTGDHV